MDSVYKTVKLYIKRNKLKRNIANTNKTYKKSYSTSIADAKVKLFDTSSSFTCFFGKWAWIKKSLLTRVLNDTFVILQSIFRIQSVN